MSTNKGIILGVGPISGDKNGANLGKGWVFDCADLDIPAWDFREDGLYIAGYSIEELKKIANKENK